MKTIKLTKGKYALIDDEDYEKVSKYKWQAAPKPNGYRVVRAGTKGELKKSFYLSRVLMDEPEGMIVDHINGNSLDNRKSNLRICNVNQNHWNRRKIHSKSSKYKGVCWDKQNKKWRVQIIKNNKRIPFGSSCFSSELEAAKIYDERAKKLFGKFACLNFIKQNE